MSFVVHTNPNKWDFRGMHSIALAHYLLCFPSTYVIAIHTLPYFGRTIKIFRLDELLLLLLVFIGMGYAALCYWINEIN